ncbi:hypothetical protein [Enterobacter asburiae]|uniref:hypothetical protein n=1 Tax=Enterobacter asburiae TaxID=61645 RepID=UPI00278B598F|nr:hypothetical protein [Enterobacter asburiae]MDP9553600.1 hypothetical protein [Enterobacter mori]MDP9661332.1 hypothetical protein [Enterobacter mori]
MKWVIIIHSVHRMAMGLIGMLYGTLVFMSGPDLKKFSFLKAMSLLQSKEVNQGYQPGRISIFQPGN